MAAVVTASLFMLQGSAPAGTAAEPTRELAGPASPAQAAQPISRYTSSRSCSAHRAVRFYSRRLSEHRARMGAPTAEARGTVGRCPRYLAQVLKRKAFAWRKRAERWYAYHHDWPSWLPDKWQRVGACETGYGQRPGRWDWNSGTYQGAFGFYHGSWDAFVPRADRKAGPYPSEAYLATPRQQYEVALAIWRMFGFSGWGCRGA